MQVDSCLLEMAARAGRSNLLCNETLRLIPVNIAAPPGATLAGN
jgi:hypothetical protein